jgi:Trk-type K+ transport system membrane component
MNVYRLLRLTKTDSEKIKAAAEKWRREYKICPIASAKNYKKDIKINCQIFLCLFFASMTDILFFYFGHKILGFIVMFTVFCLWVVAALIFNLREEAEDHTKRFCEVLRILEMFEKISFSDTDLPLFSNDQTMGDYLQKIRSKYQKSGRNDAFLQLFKDLNLYTGIVMQAATTKTEQDKS